MGASESTEIQVSFNRPDLFYYAGETISGAIAFQTTHDKLNLDGLFLQFIGEIGFTTQERRNHTDSNGRRRTEPYIEYHRTPFMTVCIPVVQPQYGQREITLYHGQYSWPFEFVLPECLPPSTVPPTNEFPYVKYSIRSLLDKSKHKTNVKQIYPLTIFPRVNIYQIPTALQAAHFSQSNRKKVQLSGSLVQTGVLPGDNIALQLTLENPKRREIKRIEAILFQHRKIAQNNHSEIIFRMDLPYIHEFDGKEFQQIFNLRVPSTAYLAPTYQYVPQCCSPSINIEIHYELQLEVKTRGLFTDFKVHVPVFVGTPPVSNQESLVNTSTAAESILPSAPAYDFDDLPPAYESAVANLKT